MGSRGPVPKRDDQRRRRNSESQMEHAPAGDRPKPPGASQDWHPRARAWFQSLKKSGQAQFYEASDWQQAMVVAELLSRELSKDRASAQMVQALFGQMTELLTTEGARRRVRLELDRVEDDGDDAAVTALDDFRRQAAG